MRRARLTKISAVCSTIIATLLIAPGLGQYLAQCEDKRMRGDKVLGKRIGGELYA
jgi:hypothetical protein